MDENLDDEYAKKEDLYSRLRYCGGCRDLVVCLLLRKKNTDSFLYKGGKHKTCKDFVLYKKRLFKEGKANGKSQKSKNT